MDHTCLYEGCCRGSAHRGHEYFNPCFCVPSLSHYIAHPQVLGSVLHYPTFGERDPQPLLIERSQELADPTLPERVPPIVAVVGSSMNAGKTTAICSLLRRLKLGGRRVAAEGAQAWNPAFDMTPAELIDVIVTERGAVENPAGRSLPEVLGL